MTGPWRYERIDGAGHWVTLDAPKRVNDLLVGFYKLRHDLLGLPAALC